MKISEVCERNIKTISKNQTIMEALKTMGPGLTKLPVTDGGKLIGIVTIRDILKVVGSSNTQSPEHTHISGVMQRELNVLPPDAEIKDAVRTMLENDISSIPILEGENLIGLVTKTDILRTCTKIDTPIRELMVEPITVSLGHSIPHIRKLMFEQNLSVIPVTDGGNFIGVVLSRDITEKILSFKKDIKKHQEAIKNMAVEDFYRPDTTAVSSEATVGEVAKKLLEEKKTSLPVVEKGNLIGIISKTDLLRALLD